MEPFEQALDRMKTLFGRDLPFALATAADNIPSVRYVDTWFDGEAFYVVTYAASRKMREIAQNPNVSICSLQMHTFSARAENLGHPLEARNKALRDNLIREFAPWYFLHNNEDDPDMCYLRLTPVSGFFQTEGTGYRMDFAARTVETFPFAFDPILA